MLDFLSSTLSNIVANIIFWLTGGLIVGFLLSRRRKKLYRFFGISKNKTMTVYLSSFSVRDKTVKDFRGEVRSYQGLGVPNSEFLEIPNITGLFSSNALERIPDMLSGLVDSIWLERKPLIEFLASPLDLNEIKPTNYICIGGPAFNSVTEYYLRTGNPYVKLEEAKEEAEGVWKLEICRGKRHGEVINSPNGGTWDYGMILRIKDNDRKISVFIVAGTNMNSTRAASQCLVDNWEKLYRQYGAEDFGWCVKCPTLDKNSKGYMHYELVAQLPREGERV